MLRALSKDAGDRYQTAEEMSADLDRARRGVALSPRTEQMTRVLPPRAAHRRYAGAASARWHSRVGSRAASGRRRRRGRRLRDARAGRGSSCSCCCWPPARSPPSRSRASSVAERPGRPRRPRSRSRATWSARTRSPRRTSSPASGSRPSIRGLASSQPPGNVLRVNPSGGTVVKPGSTVTLFVSTGLKLATVPTLKGMTVQQATAALNARGLQLRRRDRHERPRDRGDGDQAGSRRRAAPLRAARPSPSRSRAARSRWACRTCAARTSRPRRRTSQQAGLRVGNINRTSSTSQPAGTIISTDPPGDTQQPQGSAGRISSSRAAFRRCRCPTSSASTADQAAQDIQTAASCRARRRPSR